MSVSDGKPCKCGGEYLFNQHCAAHTCGNCNDHNGLARCYCGWARDGGNGYQQLVEMGERIEPEDY